MKLATSSGDQSASIPWNQRERSALMRSRRVSPSSVMVITCARPSAGSVTFLAMPSPTSVLAWRLTVETSECTHSASSETRLGPVARLNSTG